MKIKAKLRGARNFILGMITMALIFALVMTVGANTGRRTETVNITYDNIKIVINGQPTTLRDLQGNPIEPFLMDGTMFVPISPLVRQFGYSSTYEASTRTLFIGPMPRPPAASLFETVPSFQSSNTLGRATVNMLGNPYSGALRTNRQASSVGGQNGWSDRNLNEQFVTITGTIGRIDGSGNGRSTISFIGDGRELASFNVDGNTRPFDVLVDVTGVTVLRIQITQPANGAWLAFANATIE